MKRLCLHSLAILAGFGLGGALGLQSSQAAGAEPRPVVEYTVLVNFGLLGEWFGDKVEEYGLKGKVTENPVPKALTRFGSHGWQLVALDNDAGNTSYIFSRPRAEGVGQ